MRHFGLCASTRRRSMFYREARCSHVLFAILMAQGRYSNGFFACFTLLVVCFYLLFQTTHLLLLLFWLHEQRFVMEIDINEFVHSHAFPSLTTFRYAYNLAISYQIFCSYGRNLQIIRQHMHPFDLQTCHPQSPDNITKNS